MTSIKTHALAALLALAWAPLALAQAAEEAERATAGSGGASAEASGTGSVSEGSGSAAPGSAGPGAGDVGEMAEDVAAQIEDPAPFDAASQRLITSITAAGSLGLDYAAEVEAVDEETEIGIVELSELRSTGRADLTMLDQSLSGIEDQRDEMRTAVESHARLLEALERAGHAPQDVVAMAFSTGLDNEVTLVVQGEAD